MWQRLYEEINDPNFVIICAAEDTGGEAVAGPIFDAATPTYIQVVDENHIVSSAFNFVNVPSAAWIDEDGKIVRIDEGTYAKTHQIGECDQAFTFGTDVYAPAVKDWVEKGAASRYVQPPSAVAGNIRAHSFDQLKADAAFRLANLFRAHGHKEKAERYWKMAQSLNPDSINFIRQNLTLTEEGSAGETFLKLMADYASEGKDYYRPLDIEEP
ncbi:MAG: thioredoxin family protein [Planctomycetes bacterium]|nr:thioredoxin family protein [Planctomycetota bacterium]